MSLNYRILTIGTLHKIVCDEKRFLNIQINEEQNIKVLKVKLKGLLKL